MSIIKGDPTAVCRRTEVDMRASLAAFLFALAAAFGAFPANAQDATNDNANAVQAVLDTELPPERLKLALTLVDLSGTTRIFDEVLPTVAEQAKNRFIQANPQMQLGIIAVVDKVAIDLVKRRPELDRYLARVWASGFTDEEMQELIDFYSTPTGKKFSGALPKVLAVQTAVAQEWGKSVGEELNIRVQQELTAAVRAEQEALQSDIAGPSEGGEAAAPAQ
jgi:hypothetical protein